MYTGEGVGGCVGFGVFGGGEESYPTPGPSPLKWGGVTRCAEVLNLRGL